jgi:glutamate/aspartate transport system substrate-binding protein
VNRIASLSSVALFVAVVLLAAPAFGETAAAPAKAPPARAGSPDTLAHIKAGKRINVAFSGDSLPFSFVGNDNKPAGYSIDLCQRVIAHIGRIVGVPDLKVNWLVGTVAERLAMVASGKADLDCANTTATATRMQSVDFSSLVFIDGGGLLVKAGSKVEKVPDLEGKNVGVIAGTTTEARLETMLRQRLVNAKVTKVRDGNEGVAMLESGSLDAFASDKVKLIGLAVQAKDPAQLALLAEDLSIEPIAFALPRNDSAFRLEVNKALTQIYIGSDLEAIFAQWLGKLGRPSGLLAAMYLLNSIPN